MTAGNLGGASRLLIALALIRECKRKFSPNCIERLSNLAAYFFASKTENHELAEVTKFYSVVTITKISTPKNIFRYACLTKTLDDHKETFLPFNQVNKLSAFLPVTTQEALFFQYSCQMSI